MARRRREFGSIRKLSSGRYQARFWDETTGEHVPAPRTFPTRANAATWLSEVQAGLIDAGHQDLPTLERYAYDWMETRPLSPRTRDLYAHELRKHILPTFGHLALDELSAGQVRRWFADQLRSGLSRTTVAKQYRLLRSILATALDEELITKNPCQIKGGGVEASPERQIPELGIVADLAAALPDHLAAVPWIAALAGLRKAEILALARRHVDLDRAVIRVERSLLEVTGQGAVLAPPKTAAGTRVVSTPTTLGVILRAHLQDHVEPEPDSLLFTNSFGRPIRASVWGPAWNNARQAAGSPDTRLHDLRHLAGTLTAQAGATLRETMDRLGHASPQAALRYQHVATSRPGEIADAIDQLLGDVDPPEPSDPPAARTETVENVQLDLPF